MGVSICWDDEEQTIVRYDFEGRWTWEEFYPAYEQAIAMEKSVPHRIDVILDMLNSYNIPLNAITHVRSISKKQPENLGLSVFVTTSAVVLSLYRVGMQFDAGLSRYFAAASTLEEAYQLISAARESASLH